MVTADVLPGIRCYEQRVLLLKPVPYIGDVVALVEVQKGIVQFSAIISQANTAKHIPQGAEFSQRSETVGGFSGNWERGRAVAGGTLHDDLDGVRWLMDTF